MDPYEPAGVLPGCSSLAAETGRLHGHFYREGRCVKNLIAVDVGERHLCSGYEREAVPLDSIVFVTELRKLAGADHALIVHDEGAEHLGIAMLNGVEVEHQVYDRPLQSGREAAVQVEPGTGDFYSPFEIQYPHVDAKLVVRLGLEVEFRLFAPGPDYRIVLLVRAGRH